MNPKFWLATVFVMSQIGVLNANRQCHVIESSIGGMSLRGHVFKMYRDQLPEECFYLCEEEVTCQSYNVVIGQNICELNNPYKGNKIYIFRYISMASLLMIQFRGLFQYW